MSLQILDSLDPATVKTAADLPIFLGRLKAAVQELRDDGSGTKSQLAGFSTRLQQAVENAQAAPQATISVTGEEKDLGRYVHPERGLRFKTEQISFQLGAHVFEHEAPGLLDDIDTMGRWHQDLKEAVGRRSLARLMMGRSPATPKLDGEVAYLLSRAPKQIRDAAEKALADTAGAGAEWIPDEFVPQLYEPFQVPRRLASLFTMVPMASAAVIRPKITTSCRPYLKSQISSDNPAAYTPSTPVTSSQTIDAQGFAVRVLVDDGTVEDSAVLAIPTIERLILQTLDDGYEDAMINGDSTATHQDDIAAWNIRSRWGASGLGGAADHRRGFIGLRALAADRSKTRDMSAIKTAAGLGTLLGDLSERALSEVIYVASPEVFLTLLTDTNLITADKLGPNATLITGQIAQIFGRALVLSRFVSADLAATGLYTASGSYTGILAVDRMAFEHYQRRSAMVELQKEIKSGHVEIVATLRRTFATLTAATEYPVAWGYKW